MLIRLDEKDARPLYQQIIDEVRRAMVVGTLASEDALPSVRQLATELRVNPTTVQQAYRELEREGLVYVRRGQGTFVASLNGDTEVERARMAASVAERALLEAYRHGLTTEELVTAIRRGAAGEGTVSDREEGGER
ncbi:MAG TPA: GntR family transcriptional regulator [Longimicrobiales bacterium]|nr:GntR family transcriptional regulator [Longimicrobiales bacterium]